MLVMEVIRHSAEACPAFNSTYRDVFTNWMDQVEPIADKHGIKFVGSWTNRLTHTMFVLFDTPSMDNMMEFSMEPEMNAVMAFSKARMFPVMDHQMTRSLLNK
jgi:hypothetical protein